MWQNKQVRGVKQDGSREWISILAAIRADGSALSPAIIFPSQTGLQDTWLPPPTPRQKARLPRAFFAATSNGWIDKDISIDWLKLIIDAETADSILSWRLLLMDGHACHLTQEFLDYCHSRRIIVALFPSHSTHLMQPLDLAVFGPLAKIYQSKMSQITSEHAYTAALSKSEFWDVFIDAWLAAVSPKNVRSGFATAGIWPFDKRKVINKLPKRAISTTRDADQTPESMLKEGRVLKRSLRKAVAITCQDLDRVFNLFERMSVKAAVSSHREERALRELARQKKKQKRRAPNHLTGLGDLGKGALISPSKITTWRDTQAAQQARKTKEQLRKETNTQIRKESAAQKRQEHLDRQEQAEFRRMQKAVAAFGNTNPTIARQPDSQLLMRKGYIPSLPPPSFETGNSSYSEEQSDSDHINSYSTSPTRLGRVPRLPARFRD
jgi:hypothetical protein